MILRWRNVWNPDGTYIPSILCKIRVWSDFTPFSFLLENGVNELFCLAAAASCRSSLKRVGADISPQGRWNEAARVMILHTVHLLRRSRRASLVEALLKGPPGISCAKTSLLKLNRLELIFILMISKGLSWIRGCRGTLCWAWMFIPDPHPFQWDGWEPRLMEVAETSWRTSQSCGHVDIYSAVDIILSSPPVSHQRSANSPEVQVAHLDSEKTVYTARYIYTHTYKLI